MVVIASQSESFCYTYVGELKMAAPSEEKLIRDKFNLEALTVNQVKVSKLWQTGKMFSLEPKREVANRCHMRAFGAIFVYISWITCVPCKTSSDWIRVLVAVTNEILKRESSKCILDLPRVERRRTRIVTLG
jgi:hypothetical protein